MRTSTQKGIQRIWPAVWTIAGSDSGGGAGVQADLRTIHALGAHGCAIVTAVTAQNPKEILGVERVSDALISAQFTALKAEFSPSAIKTGMLGSPTSIAQLAAGLREIATFVVCDPVLVASSGQVLLDDAGIGALKEGLLPVVDLLTPNLPEAERLLDRVITTKADIAQAARDLLSLGAKQVLIKGGHAMSDLASDYWTDGTSHAWLHSFRRAPLKAHGTGCTLAAAIAACHAQGMGTLDAICLAKAFVNRALRLSYRVAGGSIVLDASAWPMDAAPEDMPWITEDGSDGLAGADREFPDCGPKKLGFYPIVDRAEKLKPLLAEGVSTAQLRIKDLDGTALQEEIRSATQLTRRSGCRLFINDYWELAAECGAYGVHLGQEDITRVDIDKLRASGLRLGISTHTYSEVARAHALRPSYLAIGPIYPTAIKKMPYLPQGLEGLRRWRALLDYPLVAIGGLTLERAAEVASAGADGVAVITDLNRAEDPAARARAWMELLTEK